MIDTPISESAIVGAAAGAALAGKRPVAELMFADFIGVSLDQLWNKMGKFRYLFGGQTKCPAVVRMIYCAGLNATAQLSQSVYALFTTSDRRRVGTEIVSNFCLGMAPFHTKNERYFT